MADPETLDDAPGVGLLAGRYLVGRLLGQGGMGQVRAAHDLRLGRDVAIKLLRADLAEQPSARARFRNEARLAARLVHAHIVAVFDTGEERRTPFYVMERLSGLTLADQIATGPLPLASVTAVGMQMLDALAAAHAAGMLHRDVTPANIMVAGAGWWKLGDFGIAKALEVLDHNVTVTGVVIGTPAYLAPERLAGGPATVSSDLYAAGMVLYEAITGRRPVAPGVPLAALASATPPPVTDLRPDVPPPLAAVVMRAISCDPAARYATAASMATALAAGSVASGWTGGSVAGGSVAGGPVAFAGAGAIPGSPRRVQPTPAGSGRGCPTLGRSWSRPGRLRRGAVAAGSALLVILAVAWTAGQLGERGTPAVTIPPRSASASPGWATTAQPSSGPAPAGRVSTGLTRPADVTATAAPAAPPAGPLVVTATTVPGTRPAGVTVQSPAGGEQHRKAKGRHDD